MRLEACDSPAATRGRRCACAACCGRALGQRARRTRAPPRQARKGPGPGPQAAAASAGSGQSGSEADAKSPGVAVEESDQAPDLGAAAGVTVTTVRIQLGVTGAREPSQGDQLRQSRSDPAACALLAIGLMIRHYGARPGRGLTVLSAAFKSLTKFQILIICMNYAFA